MPATGPSAPRHDEPATGAAVFAGYRCTVDEAARSEHRRIGMADLAVVIGGNLAAIAFCFAPWMSYRLPLPDSSIVVDGRDTGFATDGWIVLAVSVVAVIAFIVALFRADQALASAAGCWATVLAFVAAGTTWMMIGMTAPEGAEAVEAEWGVMAATGAAAVASVAAIRAMRAARIY